MRQTVYAFSGPDGADPLGKLVQAADGRIYGATSQGGAGGPYSAGIYSSLFYVFYCGGKACFGDEVSGAGTAFEIDVASGGTRYTPDTQKRR